MVTRRKNVYQIRGVCVCVCVCVCREGWKVALNPSRNKQLVPKKAERATKLE